MQNRPPVEGAVYTVVRLCPSSKDEEGNEDKENHSSNSFVSAMTKSLRQVEGNKASEKALAVDNDTVRLRPNNPRDSDKLYTFDRVFSEDASQAEVGGAVQEQLLGVLIGFNTTLICCGASKSGKSYTMTGSREQRGVLPQVVQELFSRISALQEGGGHFYTEMCYVELHNNVFHDLLLSEGEDNEASDTDSISMLDVGHSSFTSSKSGRSSAAFDGGETKIQVHESKNLGVFLSGSPTLHRPVSSALDVFKLYSRGQRVRSSRVTDTGHVSSRSHTVLVLHVESRVAPDSDMNSNLSEEAERVGVRVSKLTFVEMAGAERLEHSGVGFKQVESRHINLSLNAFGNVLRVLSENAGAKGAPQLVPYNESKLTHLLKESLGGNSRTVLITTVHATADYSKLTETSLQHATWARTSLAPPLPSQAVARVGPSHLNLNRTQTEPVSPSPSEGDSTQAGESKGTGTNPAAGSGDSAVLQEQVHQKQAGPRGALGLYRQNVQLKARQDAHISLISSLRTKLAVLQEAESARAEQDEQRVQERVQLRAENEALRGEAAQLVEARVQLAAMEEREQALEQQMREKGEQVAALQQEAQEQAQEAEGASARAAVQLGATQIELAEAEEAVREAVRGAGREALRVQQAEQRRTQALQQRDELDMQLQRSEGERRTGVEQLEVLQAEQRKCQQTHEELQLEHGEVRARVAQLEASSNAHRATAQEQLQQLEQLGEWLLGQEGQRETALRELGLARAEAEELARQLRAAGDVGALHEGSLVLLADTQQQLRGVQEALAQAKAAQGAALEETGAARREAGALRVEAGLQQARGEDLLRQLARAKDTSQASLAQQQAAAVEAALALQGVEAQLAVQTRNGKALQRELAGAQAEAQAAEGASRTAVAAQEGAVARLQVENAHGAEALRQARVAAAAAAQEGERQRAAQGRAVADLEGELQLRTQKLASLAVEVAGKDAELRAVPRLLREKDEERKEVAHELQRQTRLAAALQTQRDELDAQLAGSRSRLSEAAEALARLEGERCSGVEQLEGLQAERDALFRGAAQSQQADTVQALLGDQKAAQAEKLGALQEQVRSLQGQQSGRGGELQLRGHTLGLQERLAREQGRLSAEGEKAADLQASLDTHIAQVSSLGLQLAALRDQAAEQIKACRLKEVRVADVEAELVRYMETVRGAQRLLEAGEATACEAVRLLADKELELQESERKLGACGDAASAEQALQEQLLRGAEELREQGKELTATEALKASERSDKGRAAALHQQKEELQEHGEALAAQGRHLDEQGQKGLLGDALGAKTDEVGLKCRAAGLQTQLEGEMQAGKTEAEASHSMRLTVDSTQGGVLQFQWLSDLQVQGMVQEIELQQQSSQMQEQLEEKIQQGHAAAEALAQHLQARKEVAELEAAQDKAAAENTVRLLQGVVADRDARLWRLEDQLGALGQLGLMVQLEQQTALVFLLQAQLGEEQAACKAMGHQLAEGQTESAQLRKGLDAEERQQSDAGQQSAAESGIHAMAAKMVDTETQLALYTSAVQAHGEALVHATEDERLRSALEKHLLEAQAQALLVAQTGARNTDLGEQLEAQMALATALRVKGDAVEAQHKAAQRAHAAELVLRTEEWVELDNAHTALVAQVEMERAREREAQVAHDAVQGCARLDKLEAAHAQTRIECGALLAQIAAQGEELLLLRAEHEAARAEQEGRTDATQRTGDLGHALKAKSLEAKQLQGRLEQGGTALAKGAADSQRQGEAVAEARAQEALARLTDEALAQGLRAGTAEARVAELQRECAQLEQEALSSAHELQRRAESKQAHAREGAAKAKRDALAEFPAERKAALERQQATGETARELASLAGAEARAGLAAEAAAWKRMELDAPRRDEVQGATLSKVRTLALALAAELGGTGICALPLAKLFKHLSRRLGRMQEREGQAEREVAAQVQAAQQAQEVADLQAQLGGLASMQAERDALFREAAAHEQVHALQGSWAQLAELLHHSELDVQEVVSMLKSWRS